MGPEEKDKKSKDDIDLSDLFGSSNNINVAGGSSFIGREPEPVVPAQDPVELFIQTLKAISRRHPDRRGLGRILDRLFRGNKPFDRITTMGEFKDLLEILTNRAFYKTAGRERQEKYIRIMLEYLESKELKDDQALLTKFDPHIRFETVVLGIRAHLDVLTEHIMQRLAGDITTDAPPPPKK